MTTVRSIWYEVYERDAGTSLLRACSNSGRVMYNDKEIQIENLDDEVEPKNGDTFLVETPWSGSSLWEFSKTEWKRVL